VHHDIRCFFRRKPLFPARTCQTRNRKPQKVRVTIRNHGTIDLYPRATGVVDKSILTTCSVSPMFPSPPINNEDLLESAFLRRSRSMYVCMYVYMYVPISCITHRHVIQRSISVEARKTCSRHHKYVFTNALTNTLNMRAYWSVFRIRA